MTANTMLVLWARSSRPLASQDVAAATAAFMMLFTASSTTLQFTLLGMVDWERNFVLPLIGAVGAAFGQQMIGRLVKMYNRQSLIIFPVAGIIGLSAVLMGYTSIMDLKNNGLGGIKGARARPRSSYTVPHCSSVLDSALSSRCDALMQHDVQDHAQALATLRTTPANNTPVVGSIRNPPTLDLLVFE